MTDNSKLRKLNDELLNNVSGGRSSYSDKEFSDAGVIISTNNGKREFTTKLSSGSYLTISESVAYNMVDCFKLAGERLTDAELDDLIRQSGVH